MWSGKHEATGARLHEQWEIRVDNQCCSTRFSTQQISKRLPFPTDWTTVTQSLGQAIMEAKKPERQKHNEKKHIFHTTILEWRGNWVTASNQLLALPFSLRCDSEFYLTLCTSDLGEFDSWCVFCLPFEGTGFTGKQMTNTVWGWTMSRALPLSLLCSNVFHMLLMQWVCLSPRLDR